MRRTTVVPVGSSTLRRSPAGLFVTPPPLNAATVSVDVDAASMWNDTLDVAPAPETAATYAPSTKTVAELSTAMWARYTPSTEDVTFPKKVTEALGAAYDRASGSFQIHDASASVHPVGGPPHGRAAEL